MSVVNGTSLTIKGKMQLRCLRIAYRIGKRLNIRNKNVTKFFLDQPIRMIPMLTEEIEAFIKNEKPMLLARLGGTEGVIAGQYCEKVLGIRKEYSQDMLNWLFTTSGFFADDYEDKTMAVDEYARLTIEGLSECDFLSATFPERIYIPYFFKRFAKNAVATFSDFGPYFDIITKDTWVRALEGKKVLVINAFTDSIEQQYKRKSELVKSKEYELPDFDLITYKTYVTQVGERPGGFTNSFQVLEKMIEDIRKIDFDIALVGAGAYGFPISVEIKKMGKQVFETCGNTPLFFGVYGERNLKQGYDKFITDAWIRPLEEKPKRFKEIENGCYW